jgi:hypothetical protein
MSSNSLYPKTSPYKDTNVYNKKFLDFMVNRPIPSQPSDIMITLAEVYQYRPDLLAYDMYGDSRLWWVFAARNPNRLGPDPYFDFKAGVEFYVPTMDTLRQVLGI